MNSQAPLRSLTPLDLLVSAADNAFRTLTNAGSASKPTPEPQTRAGSDNRSLSDEDRALSAGLMRVNHVGEVCAQALYNAQALTTRDPELRSHFEAAGREETDHLVWTRERLSSLGAAPSLLNPLWYAGSFGIGLLAGLAGRGVSLGFVVETERQVEAHLESHLNKLPANDLESRAIVMQMKEDEARHATDAELAGGVRLPSPVRWLMQASAKVMTTTARRI